MEGRRPPPLDKYHAHATSTPSPPHRYVVGCYLSAAAGVSRLAATITSPSINVDTTASRGRSSPGKQRWTHQRRRRCRQDRQNAGPPPAAQHHPLHVDDTSILAPATSDRPPTHRERLAVSRLGYVTTDRRRQHVSASHGRRLPAAPTAEHATANGRHRSDVRSHRAAAHDACCTDTRRLHARWP